MPLVLLQVMYIYQMKKRMILFIWFISCVFPGFSQTNVGLLHHSSMAVEGYTLFTPVESKFTYLIDNCGDVVNEWEGTKPPAYTVYLLEDASLLRISKGWIERFSWSGELIWYTDLENDFNLRNHHDIEPLPNGNILIIAGEYFSIIDAIEKGRNPENLENRVSVDYLVEIEPVGIDSAKIVWEWHFWDHLIQDFDEEKKGFGNVAEHPELLDINVGKSMSDWTHVNGIDYHAGLDQILISSPFSSELYIIDHSTTSEEAASHTGGKYGKGGDFLWRWGNPQLYKAGIASERKLFGQHDPKWIEAGHPNEGNISVFNNNFAYQSSAVHIISSSILEDGSYPIAEQGFLPKDFSWTFYGEILGKKFFNSIKSGIQIQANGNSLISLGTGLIFEITPEEELVWAYQNPIVDDEKILSQFDDKDNTEIFRAERYPLNYVAFNGKELSPKGTLENENSLSEACRLISAIEETNSISLVNFVYEPVANLVLVNTLLNDIEVKIIDVFGRVQFESNSRQIDVSHLPKGLYYVIGKPTQFTVFSFLKM